MMRRAWPRRWNALIGDRICVRACAGRGLERARQFTWAQTARDVRRAYEEALSPAGSARPSSPAPESSVHNPMRIGIDARELCGKPTGVGRHLAGLLSAWVERRAAARHTFVLYAHETHLDAASPTPSCESCRARAARRGNRSPCPRRRSRTARRVLRAGYTAPLSSTPTVVLVHDISFAAHPEWFRWKEGLATRLADAMVEPPRTASC